MTKRAVILVLDSLGIGGAPDASDFGDEGADTLGHIAEACAAGHCNTAQRHGVLRLPQLSRLGLGLAAAGSRGKIPPGLETDDEISGAYGHAVSISTGKDTPSGHWEMTGVPVLSNWGYFPKSQPCFPLWLTNTLVERGKLTGLLGNRHASGTQIIRELGEEHLRTGKPILYTSADSVVQIAAHEEMFSLQRLYDLCNITRELVDTLNVGRVIARPFLGHSVETFRRTENRRDFAIPPPSETLLDHLLESGGQVIAIGKIADIFAHRGITRTIKAHGNEALFDQTLRALDKASSGTLIFTNFVDFDTLYGHRRNIAGYAQALEAFDKRIPELQTALRFGDMVIITADHGNDPTWPGSDHTREQVPVLCFGKGLQSGYIGCRKSFADIGQTVARHLGLAELKHGNAFNWYCPLFK